MMNFGLERISGLLEALGRPDEKTKVVHVAGTNGKGSVCAYMASVLLSCGYSVGRFNSPHLIEPRDCINVNGEPISPSLYEEAVNYIATLESSNDASSFECLVATAFYVFDKLKLEFVVLEVGLGGLLDATNAIRHPVMTVITAIGLDHANILGNTIEEIASAKAGIMKPDCPVVIAPQDSDMAQQTLEKHAKAIAVPYILVKPSIYMEHGQCQLDLDDIQYTYPIRLVGDYQRMNSATAVTALDWMRRLGVIHMRRDQLATGMANTRWPGRLDWITAEDNMTLGQRFGIDRVLVDGAHNPPATLALRHYVDSLKANRIVWVIGSTLGKNVHDMVHTLVDKQDAVIAVRFSQPVGMPWIQSTDPSDIIQEVTEAESTYAYSDLQDALTRAKAIQGEHDVIVLCGSLYLVADLYRML